jgi:fructuronate reductase
MIRLKRATGLPSGVRVPTYPRKTLKSGIVHIGAGAFHKAHQAVYTDDALETHGGDWMITGVSLRSSDVWAAMSPQNGLYTLLVRGPDGVFPRVIGSIREILVAPEKPDKVMVALARRETRIVSLTITEKGYGIDPRTGGLDREHPAIAADLADPDNCVSALGFIVAALHVRRVAGSDPFTVLCCDNLPNNGKVVKRLMLEFAEARDPGMVDYIESHVSFPSTMVDRITPASTEATFADAARLTGREDLAAVETEPFTQWIIEDDFVAGRPAWEVGGALFVEDVAPYERMKLRMLNGAHSMLAYAGFIAGHRFVRDVMGDADLVTLIERQMATVARTLGPVPGIDLERYADQLLARFANPAIAHQTWQIAMDGTQKLPQRLLEPATIALSRGDPLDAYAFAVGAWMRYCLGMTETGEEYALRDPREAEIEALVAAARGDAGSIVDRLMSMPGLFPDVLAGSPDWRSAVTRRLETMLARDMRAAIGEEARQCRG